jgi:hypothetical protein
MTQAYNLSQLANNLNTSGQLDAQDGLVNAVPVGNGGTGASNTTSARTNLDVPSRSGSGATGTWSISISGNAATATTASTASSVNWTNVSGRPTTVSAFTNDSGYFPTNAAVWNNVTASRAIDTTYTNNQGKMIFVSVSGVLNNGGTSDFKVSGITISQIGASSSAIRIQQFMAVPAGATYRVQTVAAGGLGIGEWYEFY